METEVKHVLQEIKSECRKHNVCYSCKLHGPFGCTLKGRPDKWIIGGISSDKWHTLYSWLVDIRAASDPDARKGLKEYTIDQARVKLLDNILEYMNKLDEEAHDET